MIETWNEEPCVSGTIPPSAIWLHLTMTVQGLLKPEGSGREVLHTLCTLETSGELSRGQKDTWLLASGILIWLVSLGLEHQYLLNAS